MLIGKSNGGEAFREYVDAQSRLTVWAVNHINSPLISKLGLSHIPGGVVDASGTKMIHASGPGLTLEKHVVEPGMVPRVGSQSTTLTPPIRHRELVDVAPTSASLVLGEMIGLCDPVYMAGKLELFSRNMDKVSGPKLCRAFREPQVVVDGINDMVCYDADGNFAGRYIVFNGEVFEAKLFKYTKSPGTGYFLFKPGESVIFTPPDCDGTFTTNANTAHANRGMGWICKAGGVDKLPWQIIKRYGEDARIVWEEYPDAPALTRSSFAGGFSIATEAKRRGVAMKIIRATASADTRWGVCVAQERLLDDREVKKLARQFKLKIDPAWNGFPGEIDFDDEHQVRKVPPFWDDNRVAAFFGMKSVDFMLEMVTPRLTPWISCGRVLAVVDEKERLLANKIHTHGGDKVRVATFEVFRDEDFFIEKVAPAIDMVFVVPPCNEKQSHVPEGLELCALAGLPVGIFSRSEDAPQLETDAVCYYVTKHPAAKDVFCVKNMVNNAITRYTFSPTGVEGTPGTESDMKKGE